jgi:uncharacterized membrane protein YczE
MLVRSRASLLGPTYLGRRLPRLAVGLVLFGVSIALMVSARFGVDAWDVLHQGLARRTGLSFGTVVIAVSVGVVLLWIPLRQRPGILPDAGLLSIRLTFLAAGILLNAVATGLYIGAGLGPGPRDGLMTGLARRGHSLRVVRTSIELSVAAAGWVLGGVVGIGTVAYALTIGPLVQFVLPRLAVVDVLSGDDEQIESE